MKYGFMGHTGPSKTPKEEVPVVHGFLGGEGEEECLVAFRLSLG